MERNKTCKKCNVTQGVHCFESKGNGQYKSACKKCIRLERLPFTVPLPPDTKVCPKCTSIKPLNKFLHKKISCGCDDCRLSPEEIKRRNLELEGLKMCCDCQEIKPLIEFRVKVNKTIEKTPISYCKTCENRKRQKSRDSKPMSESRKEANKKRQLFNKQFLTEEEKRKMYDKVRCSKYNLDYNTFLKMKEQQESKCYICGKPEAEDKKVLHIDHCHKTGKVRKLICHHCNATLGNLKDDINYVKGFLKYLEEHQ